MLDISRDLVYRTIYVKAQDYRAVLLGWDGEAKGEVKGGSEGMEGVECI
jgi:hypothetical protein